MFLDEANGRSSGAVSFEFDVFTVTLDFENAIATIDDLLDPGASESTSLHAFLDRAAAFSDDPGLGDGLTELQRRPPRFVVDQTGQAEPLDPPTTGS